MMINYKLQILLFIFLLISNWYIVNRIRTNKLELRHSLLWLMMGVISIVFLIFPSLLFQLSNLVGIEVPVNMLFLFANFVVFSMIFGLMIESSKQYKFQKSLVQEIALLKNKIDQLEKKLAEEQPTKSTHKS